MAEGGNGHYYEYVFVPRPPQLTWTAARDAAAARSFGGVSGHLATVTSDAERVFLAGHPDLINRGETWIGGQQATGAATTTSGWSWVTGEAWEFAAWRLNEPNDWPESSPGGPDRGVEQYLSMEFLGSGPTSGRWNDNRDLGVASAYLVEFPVPEPSSAAAVVGLLGLLLRRRAGR